MDLWRLIEGWVRKSRCFTGPNCGNVGGRAKVTLHSRNPSVLFACFDPDQTPRWRRSNDMPWSGLLDGMAEKYNGNLKTLLLPPACVGFETRVRLVFKGDPRRNHQLK